MVRQWTYRLLQPFLVLHLIILIGILGYIIIEGYNFIEALYMTTIAITTVGFGEVRPLSNVGRLFTVFLLITSWVTFAWAIARITQFVVTGEINKYFKMRKNMKTITQLNRHVILCGFGRNGQQAARTLKNHNMPFVVIERSEESMEKTLPDFPNLIYLIGDGTDDDLLIQAGIERGVALISALPDDADNVFIVLSARALNHKLQIISRASDESSIPKLRKAGADNVIMPDKIGGAHMATLVMIPDVLEFLELLTTRSNEQFKVAELQVHKSARLGELNLWGKTGCTILGVKSNSEYHLNPSQDYYVNEGERLIVMGSEKGIADARELV